MLRPLRSIAASLVLSGCTTPGTTAEPAPPPEPRPAATLTPPIDPPPAESPPAAEAPPAAPIDPAKLSGYVMSRQASRDIPPTFTARVTTVDAATGEGMGTWRFVFTDTTDRSHEVTVQAPASLPAPLHVGDSVRASVQYTGGGPNQRLALVFTGDDGGLLLAVNAAPSEWKVTRGKPGEVDRGLDYVERQYGANFTHAGMHVAVEDGTWARLIVGSSTFYVWGSAAQRKLRPGKRPMPDYVESWLDFAIVRAR